MVKKTSKSCSYYGDMLLTPSYWNPNYVEGNSKFIPLTSTPTFTIYEIPSGDSVDKYTYLIIFSDTKKIKHVTAFPDNYILCGACSDYAIPDEALVYLKLLGVFIKDE